MSHGNLKICGLEYRVVYATSDEVPELAGNEGHTSCSTNTIAIRSNLPPSRKRDTLVHEVMHAFLEASGVGSFLADRVRGDYDRIEETLIRLVTPAIIRLIEDNGAALIDVPMAKPLAKTAGKSRSKKARGKK